MAAPRVILPLFCLAALCLGLWASAGNATESPLPLGPAALPPRATFTPTDTATRTPGTDPDQIAGYVYNTAHAPLKNVALTLTCPGAGQYGSTISDAAGASSFADLTTGEHRAATSFAGCYDGNTTQAATEVNVGCQRSTYH